MEPTTIEMSGVMIERSGHQIRIFQDRDLVVVGCEDAEELIAAIRKHAGIEDPSAPTERRGDMDGFLDIFEEFEDVLEDKESYYDNWTAAETIALFAVYTSRME